MKRPRLFITESDFARLSSLLESAKKFLHRDHEHLTALQQELHLAEIVPPHDLPADVVTMNSQVRVTELETGTQFVYTLSFPRDADITHDRISVLAPVGTSLLGSRAGNVVEVRLPRGTKRLKIEQVISSTEQTSAA